VLPTLFGAQKGDGWLRRRIDTDSPRRQFAMDLPGIASRKADHIRINLEEDVASGLKTGLDDYRLIHQALPEMDLAAVDLSQQLWHRHVQAPILISSMTGGTDRAAEINQILARAAQQTGIALGLGSQRAALEHPELVTSFQVRRLAPDILLLANLGAVQLNYGYGLDECRRVVEMAEADALILHLNPLQEALQREGETNFGGLLEKINQLCAVLPVPVVVKEVGWGISDQAARQLAEAGVAAVDVAGAGGTSWSQVELYRLSDDIRSRVAAAFRAWGIPTAESIRAVRRSAPAVKIFASGGLRDGIDLAKSLALGACLGGLARPFLKAAVHSEAAVLECIEVLRAQLQIAMFACGAANLADLNASRLAAVNSAEV